MARRNSSANLEAWARVKGSAPYRASVNRDACWDVSLPSPDLAVAGRVSPGGRVLLAFELAEIRDYFVEGHVENGAQVEKDGAERATYRMPVPPAPAGPATLEESFERFKAARDQEAEAEKLINEHFIDKIEQHVAEGAIEQALSIIASMHGDMVIKMVAISRLMDSGKWDRAAMPLRKATPVPLTAETAGVFVVWQRADMACRRAQDAMEAFLHPLVEEFVARGDREGLADLISRTPPCVAKAFMSDALDYRMKEPSTNHA